jgi:two-component system sensor kinase FixL
MKAKKKDCGTISMTSTNTKAGSDMGCECVTPISSTSREVDPRESSPFQDPRIAAAIVDIVDTLIVVQDAKGRVVAFNRACERASGYSFTEVRDQPMSKLLLAEEVDSVAAVFHQICAGSHPNQHQNYWIAKDGSRRWIAWWNTALIGPNGKVEYVISTGVDETPKQAVQQECERYREQLAHALRIGSIETIASGFFHEISQPLAAVSNYLAVCRTMLQTGIAAKEPERVSGILEKAEEQADRTNRIINGLKRLVRKRSPERTAFLVNQAVQNVVTLLAKYASDAHVKVVVELGDEIPQVEGDPIQFEQVILNLMRNAIEAMSDGTHAGGQLTIATLLRQDGQIDVAVADNGPGMPAQIAHRIFEPYFSTKSGGFGLGLSISKAIIEAHGGRLLLEKNEPEGTTFRVTMPVT